MTERRSKEALPDSIIRKIRAWEISNHVSVLSDRKANAALATLFREHCDPLTILELTRHFCGVGIDLVSLRKQTKQILSRTRRLAMRLKEDAKEVREVDKFLQLAVEFPVEMDEFSDFLLGIYAEQLKSTVLSRGAGLQAELVDAIRLVKMSTGRPHYREITELVTAIGGKPTSDDDLRKKVSNFYNSSRVFGARSERQIQRLVERGRASCEAFGHIKPITASAPAASISHVSKAELKAR